MKRTDRAALFADLEVMPRYFPSWRFCQSVANVIAFAVDSLDRDPETVTDDAFADALSRLLAGRRERIGHEPVDDLEMAHPNDTWTLPPLIRPILDGLEALAESEPDLSFVQLVHRAAGWAKEFSPFEFWDVEDGDFLRAIKSRLRKRSPVEIAAS